MEAKNLQELSRKEREKITRRNEILQAAKKVFASKDYASATLEDIATEAELSKGTIYLYFNNKADLFLSTFEMGMGQMELIMLETISANSDDQIAGIKDIIQRQLIFCEENSDLFKIMSSEGAQIELHTEMVKSGDFHQRIVKTMSQSIKVFADYIESGIKSGIFKKISPIDVAFALRSVVQGFAFRWIMEPKEGKLSDKAEVISTIFLDGLKK
jgi:AcrR family transcriptional regulator